MFDVEDSQTRCTILSHYYDSLPTPTQINCLYSRCFERPGPGVFLLYNIIIIIIHKVIIESVDSISRDGMDTPIYVIRYKHPNISKQVTL